MTMARPRERALRQHRIIGDEDHRESAVGQKSGSIPEYPL